jgi:ATPases with chaperone activity, ATP-binding subunit
VATSPYGPIFGEEPFRDSDLLTGGSPGGRDVWPPSRPGVHQVDLARLFSEAAQALLHRAAEFAAERGAPDLDALDLLVAAIEGEPTRTFLREAGADREELAERIAAALPPGNGERRAPATLTPGAKRAFLDAQRIACSLRASYIGPEHLLLALAANPDSPAARVLHAAGAGADRIRETVFAPRVLPGALPEPAAEPGAALPPRIAAGPALATPALDEYGRDLTEQARQGALDPVVGREDEIEQVVEVLARRERNRPLLVGEPGVGRRAIVAAIAQRVVNGAVPEPLRNARIVALDAPALLGGPGRRAEAAERVARVLDEIRRGGDRLIVLLADLHRSLGPDRDGPLRQLLDHPDPRLIATTTIDGYHAGLAAEPGLSPIMVREPRMAETVGILSCLRDRYEAHHQVRVTEDALDAAAGLADRAARDDRFLPGSAVELLDQACARVRLRGLTSAGEVLRLEERLDALCRERDQAVAGEDYERAQELRREVDRLWPRLQEARHGTGPAPRVTARDVAEIVARRTGLPVARLAEGEEERLLGLERRMRERVVGQDEAVRTVAEAVRRARAGLADPDRPVAALLFAGPPGVGRTELARALAAALFDGDDHVVHLDMTEYQDKSGADRLFGTPPGSLGGDTIGRLVAAVRRRPHSVLLLDEIGRAHPDVLDALLGILRHGRLGADFTRAVVIMTTTVDAGLAAGGEGARDTLTETLRRTLRPDLVDLETDLVVFRPLERADVLRVAALLLDHTRRRLRAHNIRLEVADAVLEWLADRGHSAGHGARPLRRAVRRELEDRVAGLLLARQIAPGDTVVVGTEDGELDIQVRMPRPAADRPAAPAQGGEQEPLAAGT